MSPGKVLADVLADRCESLGNAVCTKGGVTVLEQINAEGKLQRNLRFGSECAIESAVVCKQSIITAGCSGNCDVACPCDVDDSAPLSTSYMKTMFDHLGSRCSEKPSRVLVLGLGGGELSQYLLHHCSGMHVDAVELNSDVIALARNYFGLGESEQKFTDRLNIEQADALTAVGERALTSGESYDAILVDCFAGKGEVPESCRSRDFAQKAKELLKPTGVFLQNIWHYSAQNQAVHQEFEKTKSIYHEVFDGALEDVSVPMPPRIRWVDILKATKK
eukprot:CAMPEP_0169139054 /NCGR_PEP_ID=MMETSP1015-20121227/42709_1 /TAXON_ID=342587 /ORGANISM="Karlodinium micrum, Strain CCMP2283" /LENGTH=275 /DNA_ID=CAMNT_0009204623 /DNA_START=141 /DNA_END=968 /DNA_ORIENTATION=-